MSWLAAGLAAASVATSVVGAVQGKQAAQEQKKAQRQQTAIETERNKVNVRQAMRQARIQAAAVRASAVNTGAAGSSGEFGAVGSIGSQLAGNIGFQNMNAQAARNTSRSLQRSADNQSKQAAWGEASKLFGTGANFFQPKV